MWAHGLIPEEMATGLCGANVTPLRKMDGGVRPIAVGEVLRRLACKTLLSTVVAKEERKVGFLEIRRAHTLEVAEQAFV